MRGSPRCIAEHARLQQSQITQTHPLGSLNLCGMPCNMPGSLRDTTCATPFLIRSVHDATGHVARWSPSRVLSSVRWPLTLDRAFWDVKHYHTQKTGSERAGPSRRLQPGTPDRHAAFQWSFIGTFVHQISPDIRSHIRARHHVRRKFPESIRAGLQVPMEPLGHSHRCVGGRCAVCDRAGSSCGTRVRYAAVSLKWLAPLHRGAGKSTSTYTTVHSACAHHAL